MPGDRSGHFPWPKSLGLKPGDWVEVRSRDDILATLRGSGRLDGMPFMPEMLQYCGRRFQVDSRAVIACDTTSPGAGARGLHDTVHLSDVRCDGSAHAGCQARCLIFWREAWLKPVDDPEAGADAAPTGDGSCAAEDELGRFTTRPRLLGATLYRCQATELKDFSFGQGRHDPRLVLRVLRSGNETLGKVISVLVWAGSDKLRRRVGLRPMPQVEGRCDGATPSGRVEGLRPGDWVQVKSKEEIEATLGPDQKNRGLWFDIEMLRYCGRKMRLLQQVDRIIEERTGVMMQLPNDCWIIEGAVCTGYLSRRRLFCTRLIYPFWREIWFRPTEPPAALDALSKGRTLPMVQRRGSESTPGSAREAT